MAGEVKKKIKPGAIELHPSDLALVVKYEVQEVSTLPDGSQQVLSREPGDKKISVKSLSDRTNVPLLAEEIVEKCKLIHPSKVGQVEDLLYQLQQRTGGGSTSPTPPAAAPKTASKPTAASPPPNGKKSPTPAAAPANGKAVAKPAAPAAASPTPASNARTEAEAADKELQQRRQTQATQIFKMQAKQYAQAYLNKLDDYIEGLYEEDMQAKVTATGMIAQLFRNTENFENLLSHETLLQTLARILREDMKRSIDLCINIMSVFFSVSNFSQFHPLIMSNQVGAVTMELIDLEIKRTEHRAQEEGISPAMVAQKALEASQGQLKLNDREKKLLALVQKQDRLLYICFYLLLNLAEDVEVERKMKKKNIVVYLVKMLERSNVELLILATTFLKKLSIYKENKEKMAECKIVDKLVKFVPVLNDVLLMSVLRLMHNLSFDSQMRDDMVRNGMIPKAVELINAPRFQPVVLGLLYHISMDDKYKSQFSFTDCIPKVYEMLMRVQDLRSTPELIALAVNITQNPRCAEMLCDGDRFDRLIKRGLQQGDELLFKVVRNISQQESPVIKKRFAPYVESMVTMLRSHDITAELFVEVLGTLANMQLPDFDFEGLVRKHDLISFLGHYAQPGAVDDDILLEVVMFVGVLTNDNTASVMVSSGLVNTLFVLMGDKKEDDEFVLQIAFTFHKFLMYDETRTALLNHTQVVFYLVDLLQDKNSEVRKVADQCLDIIMDSDEEWAVRIRNLKFESHNQQWLDIVAGPGGRTTASAMPHARVHATHGYDDTNIDYDEPPSTAGYGHERAVLDFDELGTANWGADDAAYAYGGVGAGSFDVDELKSEYRIR